MKAQDGGLPLLGRPRVRPLDCGGGRPLWEAGKAGHIGRELQHDAASLLAPAPVRAVAASHQGAHSHEHHGTRVGAARAIPSETKLSR